MASTSLALKSYGASTSAPFWRKNTGSPAEMCTSELPMSRALSMMPSKFMCCTSYTW